MKKKLFFSLFWIGLFSSVLGQVPSYTDITVQLKEGNTPLRDVTYDLQVEVLDGQQVVYSERQDKKVSNYDGFVPLKIGTGNKISGSWDAIDWNTGTKKVIIKGRPNNSPNGVYKVLYPKDDAGNLPVAAYALYTKPVVRPGIGSIHLFKDKEHASIHLEGDSSNNYPFINFSIKSHSGYSMLRTIDGNNLGFIARGGVSKFSKSLDLNTNPIVLASGDNEAGIGIQGRTDSYIEFFAPASESYKGRLMQRASSLELESKRNLLINAGTNQIDYTAVRHIFDGGPLILNGKRRFGSHNYIFIDNQQTQISSNEGDPFISLKTDNVIEARGFYCPSDRRIKIINGYSEKTNDIETLKKVKVVDYSYIDFLQLGSKEKKGIIAQEVEKIFPQAVSRTTDVVPDIFQIGKIIISNNVTQILIVTVDSISDLKPGDKVRIIGKDQHLVEVTEVNGITFKVKDWPERDTKEVFVYGREVDDFRTVDYNQIFTLNVSATQALIKEVETLKTKVAVLESNNAQIKQENSTLRAEVKAINVRLDAILGMLSTSKEAKTNK